MLAVLCEHLDSDEAPVASEGEEKGEDEDRLVLRLPPALAPVKAAIFPLQKKGGLAEIATDLAESLRKKGIAVEYDESGSIGKRYRRQDEIGTPWCFTVDRESVEDKCVTVRDRDKMDQTRIPIADVPRWIMDRISYE